MRSIHRRGLLAAASAAAFTAGVLPRTVLAQGTPVQGTPAQGNLAQDTLPPAPTAEQWAKSPSVTHVTLSPDGSHIAFIKEANGQKYIYDFTLATKTFNTYLIGNVKVDGLFWLDQVHLALSTFVTAKEDSFAGGRKTFDIVTVYNLEKKSTNVLFSRIENFKSMVMGEVNRITYNGKVQITAASYPLNGDEAKVLYRFDLDDPDKANVMDRSVWDTNGWVVTPQGGLVARSIHYAKQHVWALEYYSNGGWKEIYRQSADLSTPGMWGLARDGKSIVVSMPAKEEGGEYTFHDMAPDGTLSAPLTPADRDVTPIFDPVTFRHCGYRHFDGWSHREYFDPAMQALYTKAQAAVDGYRMTIADTAEDPSKMVIYTEGDDDAGSYYFIDFNTGTTISVATLYPQIAPEWISAKKRITYKAADGLEIEAYLTLPPNREAKALPLIMHPHGGPQARDGIDFDWETQIYASAGYAVLQPNYRGSDGYGEKFVAMGYGEWGRKMQTDLSDGVRELVKQGLVDPKRVAIVGASYGGYAALAGATLDPGVYNCAVDVAGLSDLSAFLDYAHPADAATVSTSYRYWKRFFGDPTKIDAISPIKHISAITIPVLIVHGKDDTVVPIGQSTAMASAMKSAGKDVTFVQYDHEDHWETNETARTDMMRVIMDFLKTHNPA